MSGIKCENDNDISGITTTTTGIKQEILQEITGKSREKLKRKNNRISAAATSKNVVVEQISEIPRSTPQVQLEWTVINKNFQSMTRDERLKMKRSYLRNLLDRHESLHRVRREKREASRRNFAKSCKLLKAMNQEREEM